MLGSFVGVYDGGFRGKVSFFVFEELKVWYYGVKIKIFQSLKNWLEELGFWEFCFVFFVNFYNCQDGYNGLY